MYAVSAFATGLIFGIGLIVSGMTDPSKIIGFLDVTGSWDPSLAFVMGGAVAIGFIAFRLARRCKSAFLGGAIQLPTGRHIDYCPGPAVVSIGMAQGKAIVFARAMVAGMALFQVIERLRGR